MLGSVGTLSGPSGEAWIDGSNALKLWVRDVNSRGGVDGHPIKLIVVDDQGDPSRQISAVKSIAEDQRGFAFVYMGWSNSESKALLDYLEQNKIPVVGTTLTSRANLTHPTVFPQGTANVELQEATLRGAVRLLPSVKRYGQLTCLEAPTCSEAAELWWRLAPQLGLDPRARGEVSIGQPDFTAECLSMQREQVQMLAIAVDPNSLRRLAASCARQGYRPQYVVPSAVINASQNGDENFENSVGITSTVPWQVTTGSGPAGFYAARARFAPRLEVNLSTTVAWAAGRLFELGASSGLGSPPSRQRLMDRLYQVRKETLGGLSPPLTFVRGRSKGPRCWFAMQFTDGAWRPAAGGRHVC